MGREREASRAPPVRVVQSGLSLAAAARRPAPFSPAGLQSRFGNQGAQLVLTAVVGRSAEPAQRAPAPPAVAPVANDPGKAALAQPVSSEAAAASAGTALPATAAPAGAAPAAGVAPAAGPTPAKEAGPPGTAPAKAGAEAAPAAEAPAPSPADAVAPVAAQVRKRAGKARVHADADSAKNVAQAAGKNPATERSRAGALATVAAIDAVKPPVDSFRDKLIAALKEALPKEPKNADEAKRAQGQAKDSNQQISAALGTASEETTGTLEAASQPGSDVKAEGPDTPEVKLVPEVPGSSPAPVAAGPAVPESVPPPDLSGDRAETDRAMADAGVSKDQLAKSNEPEFNAVLQAREGAERAEAQRTEQFKAGEGGILAKQQGQTGAMLGQGLDSIHGARSDGLGLVGGKQTETQSKEAAERTRVTGLIEGIKNKTREAVLEILKLMETAATTAFAAGLGLAEKAYEDAFEENKGGIGNWLTNWGDDWEKLIEQSFKKGRSAYDRIVTETVNSVADIVETRLALAKARVQQGRKEVDDFVAGLTGESAKYGEEARTQIASEFEAMDGEIDSKRDEMVTALVDQYRESQKRVSALEEKLREANKSLWQRIKDATIGIIKKIIAFKNFLLDVLARMAQVVSAIIDDPIGFLGNLIDGIMAGMEGFRSRIGQHLKKGLMEWLFGALEGAGIKIPETFDLKGIVGLVLQILGLTWDNIKARAIKVLGADTVAYLEKSWEIFQVLIKEGPGGLWRMLVEKIGDIKEMLLTQLGDFVKEKIIEAGIKWVLSLLNPVAAFIKACMAIYDIVKFFIDRAAQIASLINAILDTLGAIVKGNIAAMATSVENALARMIPVAIGFLASLLGLGGISDKIKAVIDKLRAPVNAAIDWIIGKAAGLVKKGVGFLTKKADAAVNKVIKATDKRTPEEKQRDLDRAAASLRPLIMPLLKRGISPEKLKPLLFAWKLRYRLSSLTLEDGEIVATINPRITLCKTWVFEDTDLFKVFDKVAADFIAEAQTEAAGVAPVVVQRKTGKGKKEQDVELVDLTQRKSLGKGVAAIGGKNRHEVTIGTDDKGQPVKFGHSQEQAPFGGWFGWKGIGASGASGPKGRRYDDIAAALNGQPVGDWLKLLAQGKPLPPAAKPHQHNVEELYGLLLAKEPSHAKGDNRRDLVYSVMAIDLMSGPQAMPVEDVVGTDALHPAAFGGAQSGAKVVTAEVLDKAPPSKITAARQGKADERRDRERETMRAWFKKHEAEMRAWLTKKDKKPVKDRKPTLEEIEEWVRKKFREFIEQGQPADEATPAVPDAEVKEN